MSTPTRTPQTHVPALRARRIAVIGGGSAYMPGVFRGLLHRVAELEDTEVALFDIDPEHAQIMEKLGSRMARAAGAPLSVSLADSARTAIDGADFIFTTFRPGGMESRHLDETLPVSHGLVGQETLGPGGFFMACRSVPVLLELARIRDEMAPEAWIINYTNPTSIVTGAVVRHGSGRILGLCDQSVPDASLWAELIGLDPATLEIDWVGTNHATAATRVRVDDEDATALVAERLAGLDPREAADPTRRRLAWLGRDFGVLVNSYLRYYYFHDEILASLQQDPMTRAQEIAAFLPALYEDFREQAEQERPNPSRRRGGGDHGEFAIDVMCAVAGDERGRFIINTVNDGAIDDLPEDAIVEVPCTLGSDGARPWAMGELPRPVRGLIQAVAAYEDLAVDAAATGDREVALQALLAHPFVRDAPAAEALLDEALVAFADQLPQFAAPSGR